MQSSLDELVWRLASAARRRRERELQTQADEEGCGWFLVELKLRYVWPHA